MTKFVHCSDFHVGKSRNLPAYLDRQQLMLDAIFNIAEQESDKLVVIAGDIYDRLALFPKEKDIFIEKISWAADNGFTTLLISGNHDHVDETENGYTHLRTIKNLIKNNCLKNTYCIESKPDWVYLENFNICFLCWPARYGKSEAVNSAIHSLAKDARSKIKNEKTVYYAVIHECVTGSSNDSNFAFNGVQLDDKLPVAGILLGDIHKMQKIKGVPNAWYSGSPIQHDFGDAPNKGVLIHDTENINKPTFITLSNLVPELMTIHIKDDDKMSDVDIPESAYIRIEASREKLAEIGTTLPQNVVKTQTLIEEIDLEKRTVSVDSIFDGLEDILKEAGLRDESIVSCMELVNRLK